MNSTTQKLKAKGYSIGQFLKKSGISLSSYRRYEKEGNPNNGMLNRLIDGLEAK